MVDILRKELNKTFADAIAHVEKVSQENGFGLLITKQLNQIFKQKLNIEEYPKYAIILVCAPKFAKAALDVSFDVGLLFPCSFVVYEENNKIFVAHTSIMKIAPEIGLAPKDKMQPVIEMTGKGIKAIWEAL
jgi:uncharacterized protein (DUF302 family)